MSYQFTHCGASIIHTAPTFAGVCGHFSILRRTRTVKSDRDWILQTMESRGWACSKNTISLERKTFKLTLGVTLVFLGFSPHAEREIAWDRKRFSCVVDSRGHSRWDLVCEPATTGAPLPQLLPTSDTRTGRVAAQWERRRRRHSRIQPTRSDALPTHKQIRLTIDRKLTWCGLNMIASYCSRSVLH